MEDTLTPTTGPNRDSRNYQRNYTTKTGDPLTPTDSAEHMQQLSKTKEVLPTKDTPVYDPNNPHLSSDRMTDKTKRRGDPPKGRRQYIAASELLRHLTQITFIVLWVIYLDIHRVYDARLSCWNNGTLQEAHPSELGSEKYTAG